MSREPISRHGPGDQMGRDDWQSGRLAGGVSRGSGLGLLRVFKSGGLWVLGAAVLSAAAAYSGHARDNVKTARVIATPAIPQPAYLEPAVDPVFQTAFTRVTDPGRGRAGLVCDRAYCTHRYSSAQAWNADQSLLLIANGCNGMCFLDGQTYEPLFRRPMPAACEWHPADPLLMICVHRNRVLTWAPRSNRVVSVWQSNTHFAFEFGPGKGNPSNDGGRIAVRARNQAGDRVAFAYDIFAKLKFPDIELAELSGENSFVSISPSGRYIFVFQKPVAGVQQAYVFTVGGEQIQHWPEHHRPGHGDMTIDADGDDVYVGVSKADPDKYHIIKRRLKDGQVTVLAPYGDGNHVSARNTKRLGWVFVSYSSHYSEVLAHPDWAPFYREVVALRIDGSGEVRRIAQTRNADHNYWSETHASPSPDGTQVIWSSNWGQAGDPVADYVSRLSWPDQATSRSPNAGTTTQSEAANAKRPSAN